MHYTFLINSLRNGGAERVLLTLSEKLLNQGSQVTIISLTRTNTYTIPQGVEMIYLTEVDDGNSGLKRMLMIPYYAWKLRNYSKKYQPPIIQSHIFRSNFVNVLSCMMGAKHETQLVNHSVVSRYKAQGFLGKFNLFLIALLYPKANLVVAISQKMLEDLRETVPLPDKQVVIPNPYDTQRILALVQEDVDAFTFDPRRRYIVTVGRLIALKQYDDVIHVLSKLPEDVELLMLGDDGGEQSKLMGLADELGVKERVHFLGQVTNPFKFVKQCDVFVLSSRTEGFPNVLIEAMLCQTAIVSSDCISGPREILAPETDIHRQLQVSMEKTPYGILYPVGCLIHLEKAISMLLEDNVLRQQYERDAFERAQAFSVETIVKEYELILNPKRN